MIIIKEPSKQEGKKEDFCWHRTINSPTSPTWCLTLWSDGKQGPPSHSPLQGFPPWLLWHYSFLDILMGVCHLLSVCVLCSLSAGYSLAVVFSWEEVETDANLPQHPQPWLQDITHGITPKAILTPAVCTISKSQYSAAVICRDELLSVVTQLVKSRRSWDSIAFFLLLSHLRKNDISKTEGKSDKNATEDAFSNLMVPSTWCGFGALGSKSKLENRDLRCKTVHILKMSYKQKCTVSLILQIGKW